MPFVAVYYTLFRKWLLVYSWAVVDMEYLSMGHQVT